MQNTIFVIMAIIKNFRTRYDDVTKKGDVPLYDLRKYKSKNKGHSLHKCKALDASPMAHVFSLI